MNEIKIEKGIPIEGTTRAQGVLSTTMLKMEIGDSFIYLKAKQSRIGSTKSNLRKLGRIDKNVQFLSRKINETQIRVWRIS